MKKILSLNALGIFLSLAPSTAQAAVHFITKDGVLEFGDLSFENSTIKRCASEGC